MKHKLIIVTLVCLLAATPAQPFWGAFFKGIGKAVSSAIGFPGSAIDAAGLMPVTIKSAQPIMDAAQQRLQQLQEVKTTVNNTLDYYKGAIGTLRELGRLDRYLAPASSWFSSSTADAFGTSGNWVQVLNGTAGTNDIPAAYSKAVVQVPDWSSALHTLPGNLHAGIQQEHATLELTDAASIRAMAVLGELRRQAPATGQTLNELERAASDTSDQAHALPALLGKLSVGQVSQLRSNAITNQLLDVLVESNLARMKQNRDSLARSMQTAAEFEMLAAAQPNPNWRMP